jgi:hypothetical protein
VQAVRAGLQDPKVLDREIADDRFRSTPGDRLLTGLRGKDVLLLFVESYGKVAVQGSSFARGRRRARPGRSRSCTPRASPRAAPS